MPGIPVLHSKDLVNWEIINHVYQSLPLEKYDKPAHGEGSWAPSIRFHHNMYYVYFCTPHEGLFMAKTDDPYHKWELHHITDVEMGVSVNQNGICQFSYSVDNQKYILIGKEFKAQKGRWIGAKAGLFCINPNMNESRGYADIGWFRFE